MRYVDPKQYDFSKLNEEQLQVAVKDDSIFDTKFETKPVGYLKDATLRFADLVIGGISGIAIGGTVFSLSGTALALVAGIILMILVTFAVFGPLMSPWKTNQENPFYQLCLPKIRGASNGFWDGTEMRTEPEKTYIFDNAHGAVIGEAEAGQSYAVIYYLWDGDVGLVPTAGLGNGNG